MIDSISYLKKRISELQMELRNSKDKETKEEIQSELDELQSELKMLNRR